MRNIASILGILLLASPFVGLMMFMVTESGWRVALGVWAVTFVIVGTICAGIALIAYGGNQDETKP